MKKISLIIMCFLLLMFCRKNINRTVDITTQLTLAADTFPLAVTHISPSGSVEGRRETFKILVGFNQTMSPLQAIPRDETRGPLEFLPPIKGKYRWLGSRTLAFIPTDTLIPATLFKATLRKNKIQSLTGMRLDRDTSWTFETVRPSLVSSVPYHGSEFVERRVPIYLYFNMEMAPNKIGDKIKVFAIHGQPSYVGCASKTPVSEHREEELAFTVRQPNNKEKKEWPLKEWESKRTLVLEPVGSYPLEALIEIRLSPGLMGRTGNLGMAQDHVLSFNTYNEFILIDHSSDQPAGYPLSLCFSNPVAMNEVFKNIQFEPPVAIPDEYLQEDYTTTSPDLYLDFKPNQQYTVTIKRALKDRFGTILDQDYNFTYDVGDYEPYAYTPTGIMLVESKSDLRIPATVLNLDTVGVAMGIVPLEQAITFLNQPSLFNSCNPYPAPAFFGVNRPWPVHAYRDHRNQRIRRPIDLKEILGGRTSGLIFMEFDRSHGTCPYLKSFFEVGDLGVTWKYSPENNVVWITSLYSTSPVARAKVQFRDNQNRVLWEGETDRQGFCQFPGWSEFKVPEESQTYEYENEYEMESYSYYSEPKFWLTVTAGDDQAVYSNRWGFGIDPWRFNVDYNWYVQAEEYGAFLFTEKGLYRSGETVHVKGMLRRKRQGVWVMPDLDRVKVDIKDSRDELIYDESLTLDRYGAYDFDVELGNDAPTGVYSISISLPGKKFSSYHSFRVEAYRPAEFEVSSSAQADTFIAGDIFRGRIIGRYLFGMGMSKAEASWNLYQDYAYFDYPEHQGYSFRAYDPGGDHYRGMLGSGHGRLDESGGLDVQVKLSPKNIPSIATLTLEGTVVSPNERSLSGRQNWLLFPANLLVGLKTSKYLYVSGDPVEVSLITVRPSGTLVPDKRIQYKVIKREWKSIKKARLGGRYEWESELVETVVKQDLAISRPESVLVKLDIKDPGFYYVEAQVKDEKDRTARAGDYFYMAGSGYAGWEMRDDDIVELVPDKELYQVGDTAKIMIKSPYDSALCLVTMERELILNKWTKMLHGNADYITVPITSVHLPNIYVGVTLLRGRVQGLSWDEDQEMDLGKPQFKIGYVNLRVDAREKHLQMRAFSNRVDYRPRDSVTVTFDVKDHRGKPVPAGEITLFVVDAGVLNLIDYQTPDPFQYFYGPRSLSVKTIESRLNILGERSYGEKGEERGGGGAAGPAQGIAYREKFLSTVFFAASLHTGADGRGSVRFILPDNLTKFRIMAVAQGQNQEFGSTDSTFRVGLPFMMTPSIPRFARVGDRFQAGVVLHNRTGQEGQSDVAISVEGGLTLTSDTRRMVAVPANSSVEVRFDLVADSIGTAAVMFRGRCGREEDALKLLIPVSNPPFVEAVATFSSTPDSSLEGIIVPANIYENLGRLDIQLSSTVLAGMKQGIEHLLDYPYGCLEQRLSRILPLIVGEEIINRFNLAPVIGAALRDTVRKVLDEVPEYQHPSGGFLYFKDGIIPCPYLSAYTMYVLKRARDAGYDLDESCIDRGRNFLKAVLDWDDVDWQYPYNVYAKLQTQSFCLYSLCLWGKNETGYAARLFERREQIPIFGKVLLLKSARIMGLGHDFEAELARIITNKIKLSPTTAHFEESELRGWTFPSPAKVTGFVIQAFTELNLDFPYKDQVLRWLVQERGKRTKPTTHENAFVFDAFQTYYRVYESAEPDFTVRIRLGQKEILSDVFRGRTNDAPRAYSFPLRDIPKNELLPIRISKAGTGRLYYTLRMFYAYKTNPIAFDEGFYLSKQILTLDDRPVRKFRRGDVYKVVLSVVVPETRIFAVVDDPIPAGFEPVQTFFATESRALSDQYWEEQWNELGEWWGTFDHEEYHDDRVLFFAQELFPGEHTQIYFLRASVSGTFLAPATKAEEMYEPEVFGSTPQDLVTID